MKKIVSIILIIALLISTTVFAFACRKQENISIDADDLDVTKFDFSNVLADYELAPSKDVQDSVLYDLSEILDDEEEGYSNEYKAAAAVLFGTANEAYSKQYTYFREQIGKTKLKDQEGSMIYQRLRRESTEIPMKDDTTLKLPVNHNFGKTEANFVTDAAIRYVNKGLYHRFTNDSSIKYDKATRLIKVDDWKKQSDKNWHRDDSLTYNYGKFTDYDHKKIQLDVGTIGDDLYSSTVKEKLIKKDTATITKENGIYTIYFEADIAAAAKDNNTCDALNNDNSGRGIKYTQLQITMEIWECGLIKSYDIEEAWEGEVGAAIIWYKGGASARSIIKYSYSDKDCLNTEKAAKLTKSLCKKCS